MAALVPASSQLPFKFGCAQRCVASASSLACRTESSAYPQGFDFQEVLVEQRRHPIWGQYAGALLTEGFMTPKVTACYLAHDIEAPERLPQPITEPVADGQKHGHCQGVSYRFLNQTILLRQAASIFAAACCSAPSQCSRHACPGQPVGFPVIVTCWHAASMLQVSAGCREAAMSGIIRLSRQWLQPPKLTSPVSHGSTVLHLSPSVQRAAVQQ